MAMFNTGLHWTLCVYICLLFITNIILEVEARPRILYDRLTNETIDHTWLEVGFAFLNDAEWLSITTKNDEFDRDVVAFISLPDFGGSLYNESVPLVPKLQQLPQKNGDNTWTFVTKLVQARDSFCSTEWYTPVPIEPVQISWMVAEQRMLEMSILDDELEFVQYQTMLIGSSNITRNNSNSDLSDGTTDGNGNYKRVWFPTGCDGDDDVSCMLSEYAARSSPIFPNYASIQQLQTSVNGVPGGNPLDIGVDLFLSVRCKIIAARHMQLVMSPHDSFDPILYEIDTPEIVAYFIFPTPFGMICLEGMVFETHVHKTVTSVAINFDFDYQYDYPPGLFGMLGSAVSVIDSTTLRTFGRTNTSASFITQEDQCTDEQTAHTTNEWAFTFLVGESHVHVSDIQCYVRFSSAVGLPTGVPSGTPSLSPTPLPTVQPSSVPTASPTTVPTEGPTRAPTHLPSSIPTSTPTKSPTTSPTTRPSSVPTSTPTAGPTATPTKSPTTLPTKVPTALPSIAPSFGVCHGNGGPLSVSFFLEESTASRRLETSSRSSTDGDVTMSRTAYGVVEVDFVDKGILDIHVDGNTVVYYLKMTNFSSPVQDVVVKYDEVADSLSVTSSEYFDGVYSATSITKMIHSDSVVESLLATKFSVGVVTKDNPEGEVMAGVVKLTHIESQTDRLSLLASLRAGEVSTGAASNDEKGRVYIVIDGNKINFSFEIFDSFVTDEMSNKWLTAEGDEGSLTKVSFSFSDHQESFIEVHEIYDVNVEDVQYNVVLDDNHQKKVVGNHPDWLEFMAGDGVIQLFATNRVSISLSSKSLPSHLLIGPVQSL
mmetsp:Transcript_20179/g.34023  ORF Transcript_20179/g.34023 Transcript_20179/m.34023 type:complete len:823 (-) Transcript_20179:103-2571(-)